MPWCLVRSSQDQPLSPRQVLLGGGGGTTFGGDCEKRGRRNVPV